MCEHKNIQCYDDKSRAICQDCGKVWDEVKSESGWGHTNCEHQATYFKGYDRVVCGKCGAIYDGFIGDEKEIHIEFSPFMPCIKIPEFRPTYMPNFPSCNASHLKGCDIKEFNSSLDEY